MCNQYGTDTARTLLWQSVTCSRQQATACGPGQQAACGGCAKVCGWLKQEGSITCSGPSCAFCTFAFAWAGTGKQKAVNRNKAGRPSCWSLGNTTAGRGCSSCHILSVSRQIRVIQAAVAEQPASESQQGPTSQMASSRRLGWKLRLLGSFTFKEAHCGPTYR